jgi:LysR family transcriptional regulator, glycine cleavage system transcriptional activator
VPGAYDRLPLGALRVFEAVASHLSFSAAADALNVTPAAVSQQIKSLEDYLQVPLFRRSGRHVAVSEEGLELLPRVRAGLRELEGALHYIKEHRRGGPLQVSLLASFLQLWILPRIRSFRRKYPSVALRFHTSGELVDFSRAPIHVGLRFGRGQYRDVHVEKLLDEWILPVAHPELIKQYGLLERASDLEKLPLLESDDASWRVWTQLDARREWESRAPAINDSAGVLAAAEEGLGFALIRWSLVARALQKGTLKMAAREPLQHPSAYYFVCPQTYLQMPKVAQFREWILGAAKEFPRPPGLGLEPRPPELRRPGRAPEQKRPAS